MMPMSISGGGYMRSEGEMMGLILGIAREDERIRAAYMNGSRTNPNAPKDIFQDYDIVYVVEEMLPFVEDDRWLAPFGSLLMLQEPDRLDQGIGMPVSFDRHYTRLMLFEDGNRIDLTVQSAEETGKAYLADSLTVPLLDKDGILPGLPDANDSAYWVKPPTMGQYNSACNNFWWCMQNVAKGLWRDELPYAKEMLEQEVRGDLNKVAAWWIGLQYEYKICPGKMGKYFKRYFPEPYWRMYERTYAGYRRNEIWASIFVMCDLFRILAADVSGHFGYSYPVEDDRNMVRYLRRVENLPLDAVEIMGEE